MVCEVKRGVHWARLEKTPDGWRLETSKRCKKLIALAEHARSLLETRHPRSLTREDFSSLIPSRDREKWEDRLKLLLDVFRQCEE